MSIAKKLPRFVMLEDYGISESRLRELQELSKLEEYDDLARSVAYRANKDIAEYILLSVREDVSYDKFDLPKYKNKLGRISVCRTDFYGYRRLFYHYFDQAMEGKKNLQEYEISGKKHIRSDYYVSSVIIDCINGRYIATVSTVNRISGRNKKTRFETEHGKFIVEMLKTLSDVLPPKKCTKENATIYDFCGLLAKGGVETE